MLVDNSYIKVIATHLISSKKVKFELFLDYNKLKGEFMLNIYEIIYPNALICNSMKLPAGGCGLNIYINSYVK